MKRWLNKCEAEHLCLIAVYAAIVFLVVVVYKAPF